MDVTNPKLTRKTILLPIIGIVAFFLYILIFNVDIPEILATAARVNPVIYSAAILVSLAEVLFYALSWQSLLIYLKVKISTMRSYLYVWYGTFLDIVIPAESISGELCRVYLVNREQNGTSGKAVASVVAQRVIGMGMNVVFLVLGIGLLFNSGLDINPVIFNLILFVTISIAAIMFAILLVCANKNWSRKVITSLVRFGEFITRGKWKKLYEIKEEALKETEIFHDSLKDLTRKPAALVLPTGLMAANWLCSIAVPYMVFLSLDVTIPWSVVLITSSIVVAVKSIPVGVPFEVGLPEITMTTLYTSLLGIDAAGICATVTILSRIITLWLRFGIGFAAQQWIELKSVFTPKPAAVEVQKN